MSVIYEFRIIVAIKSATDIWSIKHFCIWDSKKDRACDLLFLQLCDIGYDFVDMKILECEAIGEYRTMEGART